MLKNIDYSENEKVSASSEENNDANSMIEMVGNIEPGTTPEIIIEKKQNEPDNLFDNKDKIWIYDKGELT